MHSRRVRATRVAAVLGVAALSFAALALAGGGSAGAATVGPIDPTIADGDTGSLRDAIENADDGDVILLVNGATYVLDDCDDGDIDLEDDITIRAQNIGTGAVNAIIQQTCDGPDQEIIDGEDANSLAVINVTLTGGDSGDDGAGLENMLGLTLTQVLMTGNTTADDGAAFEASGVITITNSTIAGNCAEDDGGAFEVDSSESTLTIVNSTISDNISGDEGAIDLSTGGITTTISFATIGSNELDEAAECTESIADEALAVPSGEVAPTEAAPLAEGEYPDQPEDDADDPVDVLQVTPANLHMGTGDLTVFGTAIVQPVGAPNCDINTEGGGSVTSLGYNFSDDASCLFTNTAAGDRENAGDPGLGALADNGGPTPTRLPAVTSPLVNFIPLAVCNAFLTSEGITTDQRGIVRPQDVGCEIGAVELEALVVLFTG